MFDLFEALAEITKPEPETGIYIIDRADEYICDNCKEHIHN